MGADALSNLLKTVRLTGAVFFDIVAAQDPWAVASPRPDLLLPKILPRADHLIAYHVVVEGRCVATARDGGEPIALGAGEVVVFTNAQAHIMSSKPGLSAEPPSADVLAFAAAKAPLRINLGDGAVSAKLVCGYLACDRSPFNPLIEHLPPVMTARRGGDGDVGSIAQLVRLAVIEGANDRAGRDSVLTKLSELLFIDVVRSYLEAMPADQGGWMAGLRDSTIGKALSLMHADPARNWTIEELARQSAVSRSALAERFTRMVGLPPMQYLARWRMQIASERLAGRGANVASIAAEVGYGSEATFSRAFKKVTGLPPSAWRRTNRTDGDA